VPPTSGPSRVRQTDPVQRGRELLAHFQHLCKNQSDLTVAPSAAVGKTPIEPSPPVDSVGDFDRSKLHWDAVRRELSYDGRPCACWTAQAKNQLRILEAFSEKGWPGHLPDPLSHHYDGDARQRLADTVRGLNAKKLPIVFRLDGTSHGLFCDPRPE